MEMLALVAEHETVNERLRARPGQVEVRVRLRHPAPKHGLDPLKLGASLDARTMVRVVIDVPSPILKGPVDELRVLGEKNFGALEVERRARCSLGPLLLDHGR